MIPFWEKPKHSYPCGVISAWANIHSPNLLSIIILPLILLALTKPLYSSWWSPLLCYLQKVAWQIGLSRRPKLKQRQNMLPLKGPFFLVNSLIPSSDNHMKLLFNELLNSMSLPPTILGNLSKRVGRESFLVENPRASTPCRYGVHWNNENI